MKKHIRKFISIIMVGMFVVLSMGQINVKAAPQGTTASNPIKLAFGEWHKTSWTWETEDRNCYNLVNVRKTGYITIKIKKPYDSYGDYGKLNIAVYKKSNNAELYTTDTVESVDDGSEFYTYKVGVTKGQYIVRFKPDFSVYEGRIYTSYKVDFKSNKYTITLPRRADSKSIALNKKYTGFFGSGFESSSEKEQCIRVKLKKGKRYKIEYHAYGDRGSTIFEMINPSGSVNWKFDDNYTINRIKIKKTGIYTFKMYNYLGAQYRYTFKVKRIKK